MTEKQLSSELIFEGKVVKLYRDIIELPNKNEGFREVIRHNGGACVLAITDDKKILAVKQFRYPFGKVLTEIPAGKLETGEDPKLCALRELKEETGYIPGKFIELGKLYPTPAYDDEIIYMYMATELHFEGQKLDEDEFLEVLHIPYDEFKEKILNGEICDAKTQLAFLKADSILSK